MTGHQCQIQAPDGMIDGKRSRIRRGAVAVEFSVVAPVAFLLLIGAICGSFGVFRYQHLARLARDASRWASVRGKQYAADTNNKAATAADVYQQVILPGATGLNLSCLTYSVTWNPDNAQSHQETINNALVNVANTVTVTINYRWVPEAFFSGVNLSSTSVSVMSY